MKNPLTQRGWQNADATVTGCDEHLIVSMRGRRSRLFSKRRNYYSVSFRYDAAGRIYDSDFTAYRRYEEGQPLPILFDPDDPQRNSMNDPRGDQKTSVLVTCLCIATALLFLLFRAANR